jgi:hypothetical protein
MRNTINFIIRALIFLLLASLAVSVYDFLLRDIVRNQSYITGFFLIWFLSAYIVLPRIYRLLTKILLPDYFIGRTRNSDGILGDPINIAFIGSRENLIKAMEKSGWVLAHDLTIMSSIRMIYASVFSRNYENAPVSSLFLFSEKQDLAFEQQSKGNPRKRHHIRFWKTPQNWWLPGGFQADWLAAATFDKHVGLSLFTGQITHKIDADIDKERDYVIDTISKSSKDIKINRVEHFMTGFHGRNGGGDRVRTDGALPFVVIPD